MKILEDMSYCRRNTYFFSQDVNFLRRTSKSRSLIEISGESMEEGGGGV